MLILSMLYDKRTRENRIMSEQREDLGFDPDALRAKYREERDKRVREDANEQYIEVKGDFSHYIDDPYLDATLEREPLTDEVDVVVIGDGEPVLLSGIKKDCR